MQMRAKWEICSVYICIFQVKRTFLGMQVQHPDTAETHCSSCFWMANPTLPSRGSDIPETQLQDCHTSFSQLPSHRCRSVWPWRQQILHPCSPKSFLAAKEWTVISQHLEGQNVPPNSTKASHFLTCPLDVLALLPLGSSVSLVQMLQPPPGSQTPDPRASSLREQSSVSPLQTGYFHPVSSMLPVIPVSCHLTAAGSSCSHLHFPSHPAPIFLPSDPRICCLPAKMKYSAITVSKP